MDAQVSIIIPCYNEEGAIEQTVKDLLAATNDSDKFQVVVVDDGSVDKSREILEKMTQKISRLKVINHPINRGYGAALKTGINAVSSEYIVITDADGTYPNDRIPELVDKCEDFDMLVGARVGEGVTYSKVRAFPKFFLRHWVSWIARYPVPDINSGLRVFRRETLLKYVGILPDGFSFTTTITLAMLTNYKQVHYEPISYKLRVGKSKIQPIRDTLRFSMLILRTGAYFAPMRVFAPIVLFLLTLAVASTVYDIWFLNDLTDKTVLLYLFSFNTGMFALLGDMIEKRTKY